MKATQAKAKILRFIFRIKALGQSALFYDGQRGHHQDLPFLRAMSTLLKDQNGASFPNLAEAGSVLRPAGHRTQISELQWRQD